MLDFFYDMSAKISKENDISKHYLAYLHNYLVLVDIFSIHIIILFFYYFFKKYRTNRKFTGTQMQNIGTGAIFSLTPNHIKKLRVII